DLRGGPGVEGARIAPGAPLASMPGESGALTIECSADLRVVEFGPPVRVLHHEVARCARRGVPRGERRSERRSVVAGRRLDEHVAETRLLADFAVCDAVHRAAAGQAETR